jgi:hypothetical protein
VLGGESTDTNFIVFVCLTRLGLEATIYCTRSEHANHYTTNAVHFRRRKAFLFKAITDQFPSQQYCGFRYPNKKKTVKRLNIIYILKVQMRNIDNVLWFVLQHLTFQSEIHIGIQRYSSPEIG